MLLLWLKDEHNVFDKSGLALLTVLHSHVSDDRADSQQGNNSWLMPQIVSTLSIEAKQVLCLLNMHNDVSVA